MTTAANDHQQSAAIDNAEPVTTSDVVKVVQQSSGTKRPSHPPPLSKINAGAAQQGRYVVTPSLDSKNVELIEGVSDQNVGYIRCAIEAFGFAHSALQRLSDAREQVKKDTSKTEANQILIVSAEADKLQLAATKKFDSAQSALEAGIKSIEDTLSAPLTAKADTTLGREVREYVKNLPSEKRHGFLNEALKQNDLPTLHAVLGAQPFLSGITAEIRAHYTRALHEQAQPELAQRVAVMRKALALVCANGPLVLTEIPKILGTDWQTVQKLRKTQSAAEQALLLVNNPVA